MTVKTIKMTKKKIMKKMNEYDNDNEDEGKNEIEVEYDDDDDDDDGNDEESVCSDVKK